MSRPLSKSTRNILAITAILGLLITLIPSFLNWQGVIEPDRVNNLMMLGTLVWFIPAILLFGKKQESSNEEQNRV